MKLAQEKGIEVENKNKLTEQVDEIKKAIFEVQELASQLGASLTFSILNQSGFRRLKATSKLDPGAVSKAVI